MFEELDLGLSVSNLEEVVEVTLVLWSVRGGRAFLEVSDSVQLES